MTESVTSYRASTAIDNDHRSPAEVNSHPILHGGTDRCLSGWGKAEGGSSFAFWACRIDDEAKVLAWVESRSDIRRVRTVLGDYRPSGCAHCTVYVVRDGHSALN